MKRSIFHVLISLVAVLVLIPMMQTENIYGSTVGIAIDEENFPYHNFRWKIEREVDVNKDGILSDDEVDDYTEIELDDYDNDDIRGILFLTSLKTVTLESDFKGPRIPTLPSSVEKLFCDSDRIVTIDNLPAGLKYLKVTGFQVESIAALPEGLETLYCDSLYLGEVCDLPETLKTLECSGGYLVTLPQLPPNLEKINVKGNLIRGTLDCSNLPKLKSLNVYNNYIERVLLHPDCPLGFISVGLNQLRDKADVAGKEISWDSKNYKYGTQRAPIIVKINEETFPDEKVRDYVLKEFDTKQPRLALTAKEIENAKNMRIVDMGISSLEGIQYLEKLQVLNCSGNELRALPVLPTSLRELCCDKNKLTELPALPEGLQELSCNGNKITKLVELPKSLVYLGVSNNQLKKLPSLPSNLGELVCNNNQLTILPKLPAQLYSLACSDNQLTKLPTLPKTLDTLMCNNNQLTRLPSLPPSLNELKCSNNRIKGVLDVSGLKNLQYIQCNGNRITALILLGELGTDNYTYTKIDVSDNFIEGKKYVFGNDLIKWNGKNYNFGKQKGTDCTFKKGSVVKTATFKRFGERNATCTNCGEQILKPIPYIAKVKLSFSQTTYTGKKKSGPKVTLTDSMGNVVSKANYSVTYGVGRTKVGKYKVAIKGKNAYSGTTTKYFQIIPKGTTLSAITPQKKAIVVKWKKKTSQVTGYQVCYGTSTNVNKGKKILISKTGTTSRRISKLKTKQRYYVWVRTYKTVNGTKYYSNWSARKMVKTL